VPRGIPRSFAILALVLVVPTPAEARLDPALRFRTFETAHFQIHFAAGLDPVAERVARVAEAAHARLVPALGWEPSETTQIVLFDDTDFPNGFAFALPYDMIQLYVTAPPDFSTLSDYEDWWVELVVHEYSHVLHLDHIGGLPAVVNAVFGKVMAPNQVQPRFVIEGLATFEESRRTSGGRGFSSYFDMLLRMDVLEDRFATIDQAASDANRWPYSNIRYLYGSRFLGYVADRFGEDAIEQISREYGRDLIAYDLNRVMRHATGHDYLELWDDWHRALAAEYGRQADAVRARGLTSATALTDHGEDVEYPRFTRDGRSIVYYVADGSSHAAFRRVPTAGGEPTEIAWASTEARVSFTPEGDLVFHRAATHEQVYRFDDLYRFEPATARTRRLTRGLRASFPDVSPDGERLAFTVNHAGTTDLVVSDADARERRVLVRSRRFDQVYTPRWSPDGSRIAYTAWHAGGYRDLFVVDAATGRTTALTHDRALDMTPAWSPDGGTLYWTSDRTGIANVYEIDLSTREIRQVTNVLGGAYQPDVSPDGKTLVYASYRARGFDLATTTLDPARTLPALAAPERPATQIDLEPQEDPVVDRHRYRATDTFRPRFVGVSNTLDSYGDALAFETLGRDAVGLHTLALELDVGVERGNVGLLSNYVYGGSRPDLGLSLARSVHEGSWRIDGERVPFTEEVVFGSVSSYWSLPGVFRDQALSLSYSIAYYSANEPPRVPIEPSQHPQRPPDLGRVASVRFGWTWSNAFRPALGISPESGRVISLAARAAAPETGSQYELASWDWDWAEYVGMPWGHHVLALRVAGGISSSDFRSRGVFGMPAFPEDQDIIDSLRNDVRAPSAVLRGYRPGTQIGDQFHLWNADYRFPIWTVERGLLTFPVYLNRLSGDVFFDTGAAFFERFSFAPFRSAVGAEIQIDGAIAYILPISLRLGWAKGLRHDGIEDAYFVLGARF
jgi:hypothetical protein